MSSKKKNKHRGSLSVRLTIWYAVIFTLTSLAVLFLFYLRISAITLENINDELVEDYHDYAGIMNSKGREALIAEFDMELQEEEEENIFLRLVSLDGRIIRSSDMSAFGTVKVPIDSLDVLGNGDEYVIETMELPGHEYRVQVLYGIINPNMVFIMGISLEDNYEYLTVFRNLIFLLLIPLILTAAIIGWFLARHALKGVAAVTKTAMEISKGSIAKRVTVKHRSFEIDRLANTFNDMLDRIQSLIKGMREMNDNVAHDLRSPLTRIRGIAEMTLMGKESAEDYKEMAASTIEECDKLIDIINTILDITETEAGVVRFKHEKMDITKLIHSACELFDPVAKERDIRLVTVLPDSLLIDGNISRMQRLVTNLLENAIKYNQKGGTVTISAAQDEQRVNIHVEDTGLGIAEEDLPRIFERFYRCDQSRSQSGIGLGLSLARAIAKGFGGDISVKSIQNQGSSFVVELPV
jgi:heavy metal sensor kinase